MPPTQEQIDLIHDFLVSERQAILAIPPSKVRSLDVMKRFCSLVDQTLQELFDLSVHSAREEHPDAYVADSTELAIVATGGYGRGELAPFSDIDLAFVPSTEDNVYVDAAVRYFFQGVVRVLIDGARLVVGYGFRPISDIARLDHETRTSLVDARLVAGSDAVFRRLHGDLMRHMDIVSFMQEKSYQRRETLSRAQWSVYQIEPDIKEGAGGLRDVHAALWIAQVMLRSDNERDALDQLIALGVVTPREVDELLRATQFLRQVRTWLHLAGQKKNDVILSEYHERLAETFEIAGEGLTPGQRFMEHYYRQAERIHHVSKKIAKSLLTGRLDLDENFLAIGQRIIPRHSDIFHQDPTAMVRVFEVAQRYHFDLDHKLDQLIDDDINLLDESVVNSPVAGRAFLDVLLNCTPDIRDLLRMRQRGVLERFIPELRDVMRLVPPDPTHELTVGAHSLRVVSHLLDMYDRTQQMVPDTDRLVDACRGINDMEVLLLSGLFHDIGKGRGGHDHAVVGAEISVRIGKRLGLEADRIDLLRRLVLHHLQLTMRAKFRDTTDPLVIQELCGLCRDRQFLKMLLALTWADAAAVSPTNFSSVDRDQLLTLYENVHKALGQGNAFEDITTQTRRQVEEVRGALAASPLSNDMVKWLCESLPPGYVLNTPVPTIATHAQFLTDLFASGPVIDFFNRTNDQFTELTICTFDDPRPGFLSKIATGLYCNDVDIETAQVYTVRGDQDVALDSLRVTHDSRQLSDVKQKRVRNDLLKLIHGETTADELLLSRNKKSQAALTVHELTMRNDVAMMHTVIDIVVEDIQGLLYFVSRSIAELGMTVHTAKIATWAGQARDAFYVTGRDDQKLPDESLEVTAANLRERLESTEWLLPLFESIL